MTDDSSIQSSSFHKRGDNTTSGAGVKSPRNQQQQTARTDVHCSTMVRLMRSLLRIGRYYIADTEDQEVLHTTR